MLRVIRSCDGNVTAEGYPFYSRRATRENFFLGLQTRPAVPAGLKQLEPKEDERKKFSLVGGSTRIKKGIPQPWRWVEFISEKGLVAMERDRDLFERVKQNRLEPILRFYKWAGAAISYGRTQKLDGTLESEWRRQGLDIVRRPTGGGIVRHGNDVCFTLIWKKEDSEIPWKIDDSYCAIHRWILDSIQKLGIQCQSYDTNEKIKTQGWCFQNPVRHDLISVDKKIVGGAQRRDQETALHQGSIQLSLDPSQMQIFRKSFESIFGVRLHVSATTD